MTGPQDEKNEMRVMSIGTAAIVPLILAAMGFNILIIHDKNAGSSRETTASLSGAAPPKSVPASRTDQVKNPDSPAMIRARESDWS
jgi:hypothetical protein